MGSVGAMHHSLGFDVGEALVGVLVALGMKHGVVCLVGRSNRHEEEDTRTRFRRGSSMVVRDTWK